MRRWANIVLLMVAWVHAAMAVVYKPIAQTSDLANGDDVVIAIQNGRYTTSWYAIQSASTIRQDVRSVNVFRNQISSPAASVVWHVSISGGNYYFTQTAASGMVSHPLNNLDGWILRNLTGGRCQIQHALTQDTLIWRSDKQGVCIDYRDALTGDTIVFDQVALKKNLSTGALAFTIFKRVPVATFDPGEFGWLAEGDSVQTANTATGKITLPSCFSNSHHPFLGWSTTEGSATPDAGKGGTVLTITSDQIYYAVYDTVEMPTQCFDFSDLYADFVTCRYGHERESYNGVGVMTGDPNNFNTHINIITDKNATCQLDARIKEIPDGFDKSIRLGNYVQNYGAEDVEYSVTVDTTEAPIMLIKYLPILETSHSGGAGVKMKILDERNQVIDQTCASFDFSLEGSTITGSMPGNPQWHKETSYYWHDWATLGVDLTQYHGQNIVIKIQTYDCGAGGHFGLCYFALTCQKKQIDVYSCGMEGDTLELNAPDGFFYRWYTESNPSYIFSTSRSTKVPGNTGDSIFYCDLAVDNEFKCKFTVSAKVVPRYPVARFDMDVHHGYCADTVYITNVSFASPDGKVEFDPHQDCDSALWDFAGALTLSGRVPNPKQYFPSEPLIFNKPGDYTIKLKTCLKSWDCAVDSMQQSIHVIAGADYQVTSDTICLGESFTFWGQEVRPTRIGHHTFLNEIYDSECFDKLTLEEDLFVTPKYEFHHHDTICRGENYEWRGRVINYPGVYYDSLITFAGCDSVYVLNLDFRPEHASNIEIYDTICDGEAYIWDNKAYSQTGDYINHFSNAVGCDSMVTLHLFVRDRYGFIPEDATHKPGRPGYWDDPYYQDTTTHSSTKPGYWEDPYVSDNNTNPGTRPGYWGDPYPTVPATPGTKPDYWGDPYPDYDVDRDTICEGEVYEWHGKQLTISGTYADTMQAVNGCDSIVYIHLEVHPRFDSYEEHVIWKGEQYEWTGHHNDTLLTKVGMYYDSLQTQYGCDSIYTLRLFVNEPDEVTVIDTICEGDSVLWHYFERDTVYYLPGEYTDTLINSINADSIVHLRLHVMPITYSHLMSVICEGDSAFWNDEFYHEAGLYTDTLTNQYGCDSVLTFRLVVNHKDTVVTTDTICEGQTYVWNGRRYTTSVRDTVLLTNRNGCDSLDVLDLFMQPTIYEQEIIALCPGDSVFFYGTWLKEPGIFTKTLTSLVTFCDSVYTMEVVVFPNEETTVYDTICQGETYAGQVYATAGDYQFTDSLSCMHGCDSVVHRYLRVNPVYAIEVFDSICAQETYMFDGQALSATGTYTANLQTSSGCDSIVTLHLTVWPRNDFHLKDTICDNQQYKLLGKTYTEAGTYHDYEFTGEECNHYELELVVLPTAESIEYDTICQGETFLWNGKGYGSTGVYTDVLTSANGCDSMARLDLVVMPTYDVHISKNDPPSWNDPYPTEPNSWAPRRANGQPTQPTIPGSWDDPFLKDTTANEGGSTPNPWDDPYVQDSVPQGEEGGEITQPQPWDDPYVKDSIPQGEEGGEIITPNPWDDPYVQDSVPQGEEGGEITIPDPWKDPYPDEDVAPEEEEDKIPILQEEKYDSPLVTYDTICSNEQYLWQGKYYNERGGYTDTLKTIYGCDSIVYLILEVHEAFLSEEYDTIARGDTLYWRGRELTVEGTYTDSLLTFQDCDSLYVLYLVRDSAECYETKEDSSLVCAGEAYEWMGRLYTESGTYTDTIPGSGLCDTIIQFTLRVLDEPLEIATDTTICSGDMIAWHGQDITAAGTYYDTIRYALGCDSVRFAHTVYIHAAKDSAEHVVLCAETLDGNPYLWHGQDIAAAGIYYDTLRYSATECDSVRFMLTLDVLAVKDSVERDTICAESPAYLWHGQDITAAGVYYDTLRYSTTECDSLRFVLELVKLQTVTLSTDTTICEGDMIAWHGQDITAAGTYYDTLRYSAMECDSVRYAHTVYVHTAKDSVERDTICQGEMKLWHGITISQSALVYYDTLRYEETGCDSVRFALELFVNEPKTTLIEKTICNNQTPYVWNELLCDEAKDYTYTTVAANGCDSIVTLRLKIENYSTGDTTATVCVEDMPYFWHEKSLAEAGSFVDTLINAAGCDSIVTLTLTVQTVSTITTDTTICSGDMISWHGQDIAAAGTYYDTLRYEYGCDSVRYAHTVYIHAAKDSAEHAMLCSETLSNEPYLWHGQTLMAAGVYYDTLRYSATECDSLRFTLTLDVLAVKDSLERDTICADAAAYTWHGQTITEAGVYYDTLRYSTTECDSLRFVLELLKLQVVTLTSDTTICSGDMIAWHGQNITAAGVYYDTLRYSAMECDSVRFAHTVYVHTAKDSLETRTVCASTLPYIWHEQSLTAAGIYYDTLRYSTTECDSLRFTLTLEIGDIYRDSTGSRICYGSSILWREQTLTVAGTYRDTVRSVDACDSVFVFTLVVSAEPVLVATDTTLCEGDMISWHGQDIAAVGIYYDTLRYSAMGCDSVRYTHTIYVHAAKDSAEHAVLCAETLSAEPYIWHGQTITAAGVYYDTLRYEKTACDSVRFMLTLDVLAVKDSLERDTICAESPAYLWHGQTITEAGTYYDTLRYAATECDSLRFVLELAKLQTATITTDTTIYQGDSFTWHGQEIATAGVYYDTLRYSAMECDSVRYAHTVYVLLTTRDSLERDTICAESPAYTWHGQTITEAGTYYDTLKHVGSAVDSIRFVLELVKLQTVTLTSDTTICSGDMIAWHGQEITAAGVYYDTLRYSAMECDSVRYAHTVYVHSAKDSIEEIHSCAVTPTLWHGKSLTKTGIYRDTLHHAGTGCDSIRFELHFTQGYGSLLVTDTTLCEGQTLHFGGKAITTAGTYYDSLLSILGCDSVHEMHVYFNEHLRGELLTSDICADDSFLLINLAYTGVPTHYSLRFDEAAKAQGFRDVYMEDYIWQDSTIYAEVPHTDDRRDYPRPDYYGVEVDVYDSICDEHIGTHLNFLVSYPSWVTDVRWNDAIILFNDRYNGGYTFSDIQWYYNGEPIPREKNDYLYLVHYLDMQGAYQARLTRTDDGKTFFTCPVYPFPVEDSVVINEDYVSVIPTLIPKEEPKAEVQTNISGHYYLYDPAGKLIDEGDFEPCEHNAFTVMLPPIAGMYIFRFNSWEEKEALFAKVIVY